MPDASNKLIVRLPNWVGDVIMTLPTLQALHEIGFELALFGKPWVRDLLHALPAKIYPLPKTFLQARTHFSQHPADKALLLTNSFSSALMLRLANKRLIGYRTDGRRLLLTKSTSKPTGIHEIETFWNIASLAAHTWLPEASWPTLPQSIQLPLDSMYLNKIDQLLHQQNIRAPFIVLCPMATGMNKQNIPKVWPAWHALCRSLSTRMTLVSAPGPGEEQLCRELLPEAIQLPGLNLAMLAALFHRATVVLANDSGPMHVASACPTKVLGIFGTTDPQRTQPWGGYYMGSKDQWPSLNEVISKLDSIL